MSTRKGPPAAAEAIRSGPSRARFRAFIRCLRGRSGPEGRAYVGDFGRGQVFIVKVGAAGKPGRVTKVECSRGSHLRSREARRADFDFN